MSNHLKLISDSSKMNILNKDEYESEDEINVDKIYINGLTKLTDGINVYELYNHKNIGKLKDFDIDKTSSDEE